MVELLQWWRIYCLKLYWYHPAKGSMYEYIWIRPIWYLCVLRSQCVMLGAAIDLWFKHGFLFTNVYTWTSWVTQLRGSIFKEFSIWLSPVTAWEMALGTGSNVLRDWFWNRYYQTETKSGRLRHRVFNRCLRPPLVPGQGSTRYQNIHAKYPCAGIQTHDLLPHTLLLYHLTYTPVVIEKEIFSF